MASPSIQQYPAQPADLNRGPSRYRAKPKRQQPPPSMPPTTTPTPVKIPQPISLGYQKIYNANNTPLPTATPTSSNANGKPPTPPDSPSKNDAETFTPTATTLDAARVSPPSSPPPKLNRKLSLGRSLSRKLRRSKSSTSLKSKTSNEAAPSTAAQSSTTTSPTPTSSRSSTELPPKVPKLPSDYHCITFKLGKNQTTTEQISVNQLVSGVLKWLVSTEPCGANTENRFNLQSLDPDDYMFWEVCAVFGLRRAVRPTEYLKHVIESWPQVAVSSSSSSALPQYYLELGSSDSRLDIASCASLCPRRDIMSCGPEGPSFQAEMYHQVPSTSSLHRSSPGSGSWKKVTVQISNFELRLQHSTKYKRQVPLRESDLYEVTAKYLKGSPAKYVLAIRTQKSPDMFVNARHDSMQVLATNSASMYNALRNIVFSLRQQTVDRQSKEMRLSLEKK